MGDPVMYLARHGALNRCQVRAAQQIREAVAYLCDPELDRAKAGEKIGCGAHPAEPAAERRAALIERYCKWVEGLGSRRVPSWPVFDVVIEEISCNGSDRKRRKRSGTAKLALQAALDLW